MTPDETAVGSSALTSQQQKMVRESLREILEHPLFRKSRRYTALLEYVVVNTLEGNTAALKERTIGEQVFGRPEAYDSGNDPVVRIAAGEVRKRLKEYFRERAGSQIRIELPTGGYTIEFHFPSVPPESGPNAILAERGDSVVGVGASSVVGAVKPSAKARIGARSMAFAAILLIVIPLIAVRIYRDTHAQRDFWWPVLHGNQPALIVLGRRTTLASTDSNFAPGPADGSSLALADAVVAAQICSLVREYRHDCNITPAPMAMVDTFLGKSVVLIGGIDNDWTRRFMAPLRYQIRTGPFPLPTSPDQAFVAEHKSTGDAPRWIRGEGVPGDFSKGYAIFGRFHSDINDNIVVVIAGLEPEGTDGAWQFMSSNKLPELLSQAPKGWKGTNFEAVLQMDIVNGSPSHEQVVATDFW
jgi:hypothetical protein